MTPSMDRLITDMPAAREMYTGLNGLAYNAAGKIRRAGACSAFLKEAEEVDRLAGEYSKKGDRLLREKLEELREQFRRRRRFPPEIHHEAIAAIREAAGRKTGLYPHIVQLAGSIAMYRGYLAEMATGEGKTLSAALTAVMFGWSGYPCHIVTANDYLAGRDSEWMKPIYNFCGLSTGFVQADYDGPSRRKAYRNDIAYVTSKELVADFLRDSLALGRWQSFTAREVRTMLNPRWLDNAGTVLHGLHTAIIDEADHILIDEAVTPVIISSKHSNETFRESCVKALEIAEQLEAGRDFRIDHRYRLVELNESAKENIHDLSEQMSGLWQARRRREELVTLALQALHLFEKDRHYVVEDDKVIIVDEFTGRRMPQRTWREGLHQAVEAKEGLEMSDLSETGMRLSFQRFFRFFKRLAGMTGTARESTSEFWRVYGLPTVDMPTNRPLKREILSPRFFPDAESKSNALIDEIKKQHEAGRPVLVGVRTVGQSEHLSERLSELGLEHNVLNAVRHKEEARIIAEAGLEGRITIATNMAGRGTDIALGRNVGGLGGLCVLAAELHESRRIDRQLYGRSGRHGDPGTAQTFASTEDELFTRYVPAAIRKRLSATLKNSSSSKLCTAVIKAAQTASENRAARQRRQVLKSDDWLEESLFGS